MAHPKHECEGVDPRDQIIEFHIAKPGVTSLVEYTGWYIKHAFSVSFPARLVEVFFCPKCGEGLPPGCGACGGDGVRKMMEDGAGIPYETTCEVCHGTGEEQE